MIFKKKRQDSSIVGGFFSFEEEGSKARLHGFGYGEHIRLRDDYGNVWRGSATKGADECVHYVFRDAMGRALTGVADGASVILRDSSGKTWRGFID
jgi:hypothetical protein